MKAFYSYWYFKKALTDEECDKIIDLGYSKSIQQATTRGDYYKGDKNKPQNDRTLEEYINELKSNNLSDKEIHTILKRESYIRDSDVSWLNEQWIYDLVWPFLTEANESAGWKYDIDFAEDFQFTIYNEKGFYGWHVDSNTDHQAAYTEDCKNKNYIGKIRKLSMTINLSNETDYEGGNLKFDLGPHQKDRFIECEEIRPKGSIIVFPSSVYHQVTPVTRGIRRSLVMWALGRPFR